MITIEKKIEDYLHLYAGCKIEYMKKWSGTLLGVEGNHAYINVIDGRKIVAHKLVQPLLRPLSDITDEENKETSKLYFEFMETQHPGTRDIKMMAHMTKWFIDKQFDLFGLIEAGVALDKTKL